MADAEDMDTGGRKLREKVRWTAKMKEAFLDHLAATCNVQRSAAVIGVRPESVYALRRRDRDFAAGWGEAIVQGYEMLELQLIGHAMEGGGTAMTNGAVGITGPIDVFLAQQLLVQHRAAPGRPRRGGHALRPCGPQETDAAILKKLAAITRHDAKPGL